MPCATLSSLRKGGGRERERRDDGLYSLHQELAGHLETYASPNKSKGSKRAREHPLRTLFSRGLSNLDMDPRR